MHLTRWEDEENGSEFTNDGPELQYAPSVREGDLTVGIWAVCDVVDWLGRGAQNPAYGFRCVRDVTPSRPRGGG